MRIPLGVSDFRELRQGGYDYIDKTLLIHDLLADSSKVILLPRPRRFGKTLNLSMLRYYLERPPADTPEDRWPLFQDLAIAGAPAQVREHFGRYPTIHLSFKDIKDQSWEECRANTAKLLARLYGEHRALLSTLAPWEQQNFLAVLERRADDAQLQGALLDLSRYLAQHHSQPVVVLLDEYDTPLHTAHLQGHYPPALSFYRTLYSAVLKDNVHLYKGVLSGVLRVAKDNIFTGLNNIDTYSLLSRRYATAFGFTQDEVEALLRKADMLERLPEVQRWYNGYLFGGKVIYNPWSVLSFVKHQPDQPEPYWANTSGNDLVKDLLLEQGEVTQDLWAELLRGGTVEQPIVESVALRDLKAQPELLWSVLLFSGYLKVLSRRQLEDGAILGTLAIPNQEVRTIFATQFAGWLSQGLGGDSQRRDFLRSLLAGDAERVEQHLRQWLLRHASYFDTPHGPQPERFYQGLVLGLLVSLGSEYDVRSNQESGYGRCDIVIAPLRPGRAGVVLELKVANQARKETLSRALAAAQEQLRERAYAAGLRERGADPVHELAVAWLGKEVQVAPPPARKGKAAARKAGGRKAAPRKKR